MMKSGMTAEWSSSFVSLGLCKSLFYCTTYNIITLLSRGCIRVYNLNCTYSEVSSCSLICLSCLFALSSCTYKCAGSEGMQHTAPVFLQTEGSKLLTNNSYKSLDTHSSTVVQLKILKVFHNILQPCVQAC